MTTHDEDYRDAVRRRSMRMARARRDKTPVWVVLGRVGSIGWQVSLPIIAGASIGHTIDMHSGSTRGAAVGVGVGLVLGSWGAWRTIMSVLEDEPGEADVPGEEGG